jgi:hypothetical protein
LIIITNEKVVVLQEFFDRWFFITVAVLLGRQGAHTKAPDKVLCMGLLCFYSTVRS